MNDKIDKDELDYTLNLNLERELFLWVLERYSSFEYEDAVRRSEQLYRYRPPQDEFRRSTLHRISWDWAMIEIYGESFRVERPSLAKPAEEYERMADEQWERLEQKEQKRE